MTIGRSSATVVALTVMICTLQSKGHSQAPGPAGVRSDVAAPDRAAVVPFTIRVSNELLSDLRQRLDRARYADQFPDAQWDYGMDLAYLKELVGYWRTTYDWRAQERRLN